MKGELYEDVLLKDTLNIVYKVYELVPHLKFLLLINVDSCP